MIQIITGPKDIQIRIRVWQNVVAVLLDLVVDRHLWVLFIFQNDCICFATIFSIKFWSDELLNMFNKKHRHVWTRRGVHLDSTHEKEKCCILPKNMNLCVLLLLPTSFCATFILLTTTTNTSSLLLLSSPPSFVSLLFIG